MLENDAGPTVVASKRLFNSKKFIAGADSKKNLRLNEWAGTRVRIPDNLLISSINLKAIQKRNGFPSPINLNVPERFIKNFSDSFLLNFNFSLNC